jgi:hypothetical protein
MAGFPRVRAQRIFKNYFAKRLGKTFCKTAQKIFRHTHWRLRRQTFSLRPSRRSTGIATASAGSNRVFFGLPPASLIEAQARNYGKFV